MPFIVKPSGDVTSRNIPETSVVRNDEQFFDMLNRFDGIQKNDFFIESFIAGRELNISLLSDSGRIEVLPPSEIVFGTFPEGKRRNVNYDVKWTPDSREYHHRSRTFEFLPEDQPLLNKCKKIACRCWECFGLHGYGRIDFRIDAQNNPWVIDVNANPCLAPDSGFIATARSAGYTYEGIITRILDGACFHSSRFRGNNVVQRCSRNIVILLRIPLSVYQ